MGLNTAEDAQANDNAKQAVNGCCRGCGSCDCDCCDGCLDCDSCDCGDCLSNFLNNCCCPNY